jgi:hypothetical protein
VNEHFLICISASPTLNIIVNAEFPTILLKLQSSMVITPPYSTSTAGADELNFPPSNIILLNLA